MVAIRSKSELEKIRQASKLTARTLAFLKNKVVPGITTAELDNMAAKFISALGGRAASLGYHGYPAHICTSINEQVVHGIPGARMLRKGDIVSIDIVVEYQGYFGDSAITIGVGKISKQAANLIFTTKQALRKGIQSAKSGNRVSDISYAVEQYVKKAGFSVVRDFTGHGIGAMMHEEPQIPNYGKPGRGVKLKPGMVLAIEPMVNIGTWQVEILEDHWTVVTKDNGLSAHFEHTICITDKDAEVFTLN
ncbi:MAG: type I methionyl aminopeptidase [Candidatus Omnitrophota bacterium]|nr:MAG: type I methionyl aminopeptidase [Candidatus Omnitrophota bacterium]